ncbi:MAG: aminotransferase class V-fold PLP-dependent enzyme [Pseudohongiellaceae bacterium]
MRNKTENICTNRRDFLKGGSAALVAAASMTVVQQAFSQGSSSTGSGAVSRFSSQAATGSDEFWMDVKREFDFAPGLQYMNTGTTGSMPVRVRENYERNMEIVTRNPRESFGGTAPMRESLAPQFGANTDEFVISGNTTDGMNMTLHGFVWDRNDAIITTNHEHPAGIGPMSVISDRYGVGIYEVALPVGGHHEVEYYVDLFQQKIDQARRDGRTPKLIVFSSPTYVTGTMLPIRELADLAISERMYTLCDSAHGTGMLNLDCHALGIDFLAASGHKWQCGPGGTGVWYARNRADNSNPLPLPAFYPVRGQSFRTADFSSDPEGAGGARNYDIAAHNTPGGNPNYPQLLAFVDTCNLWHQIGRQAIEDRIMSMSAYVRSRIVDEWGEQALISDANPALSCGLTAFMPTGAFNPTDVEASNNFVNRLREETGFVIRNTSVTMPDGSPSIRPLRISGHIFHDMRDMEMAMDAIIEITRRSA